MKALARQGVARVPGGRATPSDRKIENDALITYDQAEKLLGFAITFCLGAAFGLLLALVFA